MHKYERFMRNLDYTSMTKFCLLCTKVCMKLRFTHFFKNSYLFDRIQAILESVFFQESRSFSSQDSEVGECCLATSWIRILRRMLGVWTVTYQPLPSLQFDGLSVRSHYPAKEEGQIEVALKVDTSGPIWHDLQ